MTKPPVPEWYVRQPNKMSCLAACVAMACGCSIQEIFEFCGHDGMIPHKTQPENYAHQGFRISEMVRFMLNRGNAMLGCWLERHDEFLLPPLANGYRSIKHNPAIFTVKSRVMPGCLHALFWDGEWAYDPDDDAHPVKAFDDYWERVVEWWPVVILGDG